MSVKYKIRDQHGLNYLTCSIVGWVDLFSRQAYRDIVLDSWRYCQQYKGFQVHAYTVMSNHLHLIASCQAPPLLARGCQHQPQKAKQNPRLLVRGFASFLLSSGLCPNETSIKGKKMDKRSSIINTVWDAIRSMGKPHDGCNILNSEAS